MSDNIGSIIFELEELEAKIHEFLQLYDREDQQFEEPLKLLLDRINGTAILYGNIVQFVLDIEAKSRREMHLHQLLVPASFEGGWYYVPHSHPQTEGTEMSRSVVPNHSGYPPKAE
jgi:hypothetical protein